MASLQVFIDVTLQPHCVPGFDSSSKRNEYQGYFLGGKGGRYLGLITYHLHVPIVMKLGSLNLLEYLGPVQACIGIALPLTVTAIVFVS
jgi:hypothetical protein